MQGNHLKYDGRFYEIERISFDYFTRATVYYLVNIEDKTDTDYLTVELFENLEDILKLNCYELI